MAKAAGGPPSLKTPRRPHLGAKVSEFSEAYRGAFAIHRALSTVVSKMTSGCAVNVAEVIQQLGVEASTIPEQELVGAIASAAKEAGLKIRIDEAYCC